MVSFIKIISTIAWLSIVLLALRGVLADEPRQEQQDEDETSDAADVMTDPATKTEQENVIVYSDPPHKIPGVVSLHDGNFEHLTQAATGQTTGSWLIYFYSESGDDNNNQQPKMTGSMPTADTLLEEYHLTVAAMNVVLSSSSDASSSSKLPISTATYRRFQIYTLPSFLLIHRGKMYKVPTKKTTSWDELINFVQNPDPTLAQDVPPVPTIFSKVMKQINKDKQHAVIVFVTILSIMSISVGLIFWIFSSSTSKTSTTKKKN